MAAKTPDEVADVVFRLRWAHFARQGTLPGVDTLAFWSVYLRWVDVGRPRQYPPDLLTAQVIASDSTMSLMSPEGMVNGA